MSEGTICQPSVTPPSIAPHHTTCPCHFVSGRVLVASVPRGGAVAAGVDVVAVVPCSSNAVCTFKACFAAGLFAVSHVILVGAAAVSNTILPRAVRGVARFKRFRCWFWRCRSIRIAGAAMRLWRAVWRTAREPVNVGSPLHLRDGLRHACNLFLVCSSQPSDGGIVLLSRHGARVPASRCRPSSVPANQRCPWHVLPGIFEEVEEQRVVGPILQRRL